MVRAGHWFQGRVGLHDRGGSDSRYHHLGIPAMVPYSSSCRPLSHATALQSDPHADFNVIRVTLIHTEVSL